MDVSDVKAFDEGRTWVNRVTCTCAFQPVAVSESRRQLSSSRQSFSQAFDGTQRGRRTADLCGAKMSESIVVGRSSDDRNRLRGSQFRCSSFRG